MEAPYRRVITRSLLQRIRAWLKELETDPGLLDDEAAVLPEDYSALEAAHDLLMRSCLMGMDAVGRERERRGADFADDPIMVLPYEEALAFLQTQIPLTKKAYYDLDDKLRLRAFTVGRLNDVDAVNRVKGIISTNLERGGTLSDFYQMTDAEILNGLGFGEGDMSYWETVYRTNEATAHNAGRAMDFEAFPPVALELVGIQDARQTSICYELTNKPFIRPYNDPVWQSLWPPFHFGCRTTVRGIYDRSELDAFGGPEKAYTLGTKATPQKGFGGYPLDKESYWRLTPEMVDRARKYGIDGEIVAAAIKLGMQNYALELVKEYTTIYIPAAGSGYVKRAINAPHSRREMSLAEKAADDGHQIYLLPENHKQDMKNPDIIIDNELGDIKQPTSKKLGRIDEDIRDTGHKGATVALMEIRDDLSWSEIESTIKNRMSRSIVEKAFVYWHGYFSVIKK
jgi:hypothetical protein